jgi:hypothetical protein
MDIPTIGSSFFFDGVNWIVVGIGNTPFVHKANKGIFALINVDEMETVLIIIRKKKGKISVDPSIPSVKTSKKELLTMYGDVGTYALLEFDKFNNQDFK